MALWPPGRPARSWQQLMEDAPELVERLDAEEMRYECSFTNRTGIEIHWLQNPSAVDVLVMDGADGWTLFREQRLPPERDAAEQERDRYRAALVEVELYYDRPMVGEIARKALEAQPDRATIQPRGDQPSERQVRQERGG